MTKMGPRKEALRYLTEGIHRTIDSIDCALTDQLVDAIYNADRVFLYGAGRSGFVARCFAMRLGHLGIPVVRMSIDETDPSGERDLAIVISGTGATQSSIFYARSSTDGGTRVACITQNADSRLAEMSDIPIHLDTPTDEKQPELAPMGTIFEDSCLIYLDTLVVDLMVRMDETEESMRKRHGQLY
ncbi:MAG: SIS domain-containing protein [Thermoplasmata archaeon]|nr:SIS domain-containing protein [Thermoplasmata archaeon]MCK5413963.1 SIS domain-containing protein [Thermoplasmata archaeon]